jgi:hypothetical protein
MMNGLYNFVVAHCEGSLLFKEISNRSFTMSGKPKVEGITEIGPMLGYCLMRALISYFGNALDPGFNPTN